MTIDPERASQLLARIHTGAWLDRQTFPPLQWIVPSLVAEGFGLLVGAPKLGKSWLALNLGLAAAAGGYALGKIPVDERPVLYAALEDGNRRMQTRCRRILEDGPIPEGFEYFTSGPSDEVMDTIEAWLDGHPSGFVMLDTLAKVMPRALPGENDYQRDSRIGTRLKNLADAHEGSCVMVVHHSRKMAASDFAETSSGTNGLTGAADWVIVLGRERGTSKGLLKVTGRDVAEDEYSLDSSEGVWTLDGDTLRQAAEAAQEAETTRNLGDRSAAIIAMSAEHPEGVRAALVAAELDIAVADAGKYLKRLADAGKLRRAERGLYMCVQSVQSVQFENDRDESQLDTSIGQPAIENPSLTRQLDTLDELDTDSQINTEPTLFETTRSTGRTCPECGEPVPPGKVRHPACMQRAGERR